ncbi:MAG: rod shape-determining protein MreD [Bacillota bacterium]
MRQFIFLGLVMLAVLIQTTALNVVRIWGVIPDLVMILVVFNGFLRGPREGAFLGLVAGALVDFAAGTYFGLNTLTLFLAGYLAGLAESRLYKDSAIVVMGLVGLLTVVCQLAHYLLLLFVDVAIAPAAAFRTILPVAIYNTLVAPLFYWRYYRSYRKGWLRDQL